MEKWFLSKENSGVTLFVNDVIHGEVDRIQPVKTETGMVKATFTNPEREALKLKLKSFDRCANSLCGEFSEKELMSRTVFLQKYDEVFVVGTDDSLGSMTNTATDVELDTTEEDCSSPPRQKTSTLAASDEKTAAPPGVKKSTSSGEKTLAAPPVKKTVYSSDQKLLGEGIDVHIDNLVEPVRRRRVRGLDMGHVLFLEKSFMASPGQLHLLIGNINSDVTDVAKLKEAGSYEVEVLGGNHTRAALQSLKSKDLWPSPYVKMNVFRKLTTIEALQQGQLHNDVLEKSKKPTFMDHCQLIRSLKPEGETPDDIRSWKEDLMQVYSCTSIKQVSNNLKNYLKLCRAPEEVWNKVLRVDQLWNEGLIKIKGKPGPIEQTFFIPFFRVMEEDLQVELLDVLMEEGQKVFEERVRSLQPQQKKKKATDMPDENEMSEERRMDDLQSKVAELERINARLVLENSILKKKNDELMQKMSTQVITSDEEVSAKEKSTSSTSSTPVSSRKENEQCAKTTPTTQQKPVCPPKGKKVSTGSKRQHEQDTTNSREKRKKLEATTYQVGEIIEAYWKDVNKELCKWYGGSTILKVVANDKYLVRYYDGDELTISSKWIRRESPTE